MNDKPGIVDLAGSPPPLLTHVTRQHTIEVPPPLQNLLTCFFVCICEKLIRRSWSFAMKFFHSETTADLMDQFLIQCNCRGKKMHHHGAINPNYFTNDISKPYVSPVLI